MVGVFMYSVFIYVLVTFALLTAVTLSQLAVKLVYLDALCLSSHYRCTLLIFRLQGSLSSALPSHRESS